MYCAKCGKQIDDSSKLCEHCGATTKIPSLDAMPQTSAQKSSTNGKYEKKNGFFAEFWAEMTDLLKHPKKLIPTFVLAAIWLILPIIMGFIPTANLPVVRFLATLTYANGGVFGGFFGTVGGIFGKAVFAAVVNGIVLSICAKKNPFKGIQKGIGGVFTDGLKAISPLLFGGGTGLVLYWLFNITSAPQNSAVAIASAIASIEAIAKQNGLLFTAVFYILKKTSKGKTPSRIAVSRILTGLTGGFTIGFALTFIRYSFVIVLLGLVMLGAGVAILLIGKNGAKRVTAAMALVLMLVGTVLPFMTVTVFAESDLPEGYIATDSSFHIGVSSSAVSNYDGFYLKLVDVTSAWMSSTADYASRCETATTDIVFDDMYYTLVKKGNNPDFTLTGHCSFSGNGRDGEVAKFGQYTYSFDYSFSIKASFEGWSYNNAIFKIDGTEQASWSSDEPGFANGNETNTISGESNNDNCSWKADPDDKDVKYLLISSNGIKPGILLKFQVLGLLPKSGDTSSERDDTSESIYEIDDSEVIPYRGHLTYTNGKTNKHGQPFPDLMDFDGDGELTWEDERIRTTLSHNPDYLDTPEGIALVAVAILTAVLGGVLGVGISTIGGAGGSALGGMKINLEFSDDEDGKTERTVTNVETDEDGTVTTYYSDGTESYVLPNGTKGEIAADGTVTAVNPDGDTVIRYPDGTTVLKEADGRETIYTSDGSIIEKKVVGGETVVVKTETNSSGPINGNTDFDNLEVTKHSMSFEGGDGELDLDADDPDFKLTGANGTVCGHQTTDEPGKTTVEDFYEKVNEDGMRSSVSTVITTVTNPVTGAEVTTQTGSFKFSDAEGYVKGTIATDAEGNQITTYESSDGTSYYNDEANSILKYTGADGSYINSTPERLKYNIAETGDSGNMDLTNGKGEMFLTDEYGNKQFLSSKDGVTSFGFVGDYTVTTNGDGTVEFTNEKTGESRTVTKENVEDINREITSIKFDNVSTGIENNSADDTASSEREYDEFVTETDRFISTDDAGDLSVSDPATGKTTQYIYQEDGSYKSTVSGQTYTKDEIRNDVAYTARNAGYVSDVESKRAAAADEQFKDNQVMSESEKQYAKQYQEEKEKQAREEKIYQVGKHHGIYSGDEKEISEKLKNDQSINEKFQESSHKIARNYNTVVVAAENSKKIIDIAADVVATADKTGVFKDVYSTATTYAGNYGEAMAGNISYDSVWGKSAIDSAVEIAKNRSQSVVSKFVSNTIGDGIKEATGEIAKMKQGEINDPNSGALDKCSKAFKKGMASGFLNASVDVGVSGWNGALKGDGKTFLTDAGEAFVSDTVKSVLPEVELPDKKN